MKLNKTIISSILSIFFALNSHAQQVNTNYFIENSPIRHTLNPSFQPDADLYIGLPVVGLSQFNVGNNSLTLKDIIYNSAGQTITFLNPNGNVDKFFNTLNPSTVIRANFQTNLLSIGFRKKDNYWTISLTEKMDGMVSVPKDLFKLLFYGTPDSIKNSYNLATLQTDASIYTEAAFGFSRKVDNNLTLGGKIKFLIGSVNISNTNQRLDLEAGIGNWNINGNGSVNYSGPFQATIGSQFQSISISNPAKTSDWLMPAGLGAGIDLGLNYKFENHITLSAALIDLGFINWYRNTKNVNYNVNFNFNGFKQFDSNSITSVADFYNKLTSGTFLTDSLLTALKSSANLTQSNSSYTTATTAKLNLGFEYNMLDDKLSAGLLSHTQFFKNTVTEEITASVIAKPAKWLNASLSYSFFNGQFSSIGVGFGVKRGFVHWFVSADYIPFQKVTVPLSSPILSSIAVPYNTKDYNLSAGINLVFNTPANKLRKEKAEQAGKLGLKNKTQEIPANPWLNVRKKPTKKSLPKTINHSTGLHPNTKDKDCKCETN